MRGSRANTMEIIMHKVTHLSTGILEDQCPRLSADSGYNRWLYNTGVQQSDGHVQSPERIKMFFTTAQSSFPKNTIFYQDILLHKIQKRLF